MVQGTEAKGDISGPENASQGFLPMWIPWSYHALERPRLCTRESLEICGS